MVPNFFKYCYLEVFLIFNGSPLAGPENSWRVSKSHLNCNVQTIQMLMNLLGTCQMPMVVSKIGNFEEKNDVQFNVFR